MLQDNHGLNHRLDFLIKHFGLNQKHLAEKANVSPSTMSAAITQNKVGEQIIYTVLNLYPEVSAEWFMRGEGPMLRPLREIGLPVVSTDPLLAKLQEFRAMLRLIGRELDDFTESLQNQVDKPPSTP